MLLSKPCGSQRVKSYTIYLPNLFIVVYVLVNLNSDWKTANIRK